MAIYIRNLATGSGKFRKLSKSMAECFPAQLDWLQELTKLSHTYRSCFFTLGSSYIITFGAFCWLPEMQANTSSPAFFVLWGIIFVVIVLLFPVVSILEYMWIKRIVEHLKSSYIEDLEAESRLSLKASTHVLSPSTERLAQALYAMQIMNSRDYPLKSAWTSCYATVLSIFNVICSRWLCLDLNAKLLRHVIRGSKQQGIGAICLGNMETAFSYKNTSNETQGELRRTGIFLRENGSAGTIQHIDMVI